MLSIPWSGWLAGHVLFSPHSKSYLTRVLTWESDLRALSGVFIVCSSNEFRHIIMWNMTDLVSSPLSRNSTLSKVLPVFFWSVVHCDFHVWILLLDSFIQLLMVRRCAVHVSCAVLDYIVMCIALKFWTCPIVTFSWLVKMLTNSLSGLIGYNVMSMIPIPSSSCPISCALSRK